MKLSLAAFENINLLSNRNVENILRKVINESSNAALVNVFDDSVVLYDHTDGKFRTADYNLDKDNLKVTLENFEEVELVQYEESTTEMIESFFEDEASVEQISESYRKEIIGRDSYVKDLVNESLSSKNFFGTPDFSQIEEAKARISISSKDMKFFEAYQERIKEVPMTKIVSFDWVNTVAVSLDEMEQERVVASVNVAEAHDFWRNKEFKSLFQEAATTFIDDVEEGASMFESLSRTYPAIMFLEAEDRKALFGKSMLGNKTLTENLGDVLKGLDVLFEKLDVADLKEEYAGKVSDEEGMAPVMTEEEIDAVISDLNELVEKIEDENTIEYVNGLIESVETFKYDGISPSVVKEIVSILGSNQGLNEGVIGKVAAGTMLLLSLIGIGTITSEPRADMQKMEKFEQAVSDISRKYPASAPRLQKIKSAMTRAFDSKGNLKDRAAFNELKGQDADRDLFNEVRNRMEILK